MGFFKKKISNKEILQKCSRHLIVFYSTIFLQLFGKEPAHEFHTNTSYFLPIILGHVRADFKYYKGITKLTEAELNQTMGICKASMDSHGFSKNTKLINSEELNEEYMTHFYDSGASIANAIRESSDKWLDKISDLVSDIDEFNEMFYEVAGDISKKIIDYHKSNIKQNLSESSKLKFQKMCSRYEISDNEVSELTLDFEKFQEYIYQKEIEIKRTH